MTDELLYTKIARHFADTGSPAAGPPRRARRLPRGRLLDPARAALRSLRPGRPPSTPRTCSTPCCSRARRSRSTCSGAASFRPSARSSSPCCRWHSVGREHGDSDVGVRRLPRLRLGRARLPRRARRGRRRVVTHSRSARSRSPSSRDRSSSSSQACSPLAALVLDGPRQALRRHRVLTGAYVAAALVVVPLAALGESHRLLGDYGVTATEGSLLPSGVWKAAAIHLDVVAVGLGVIPFLLGTAWTYSNLRTGPVAARAFATFAGTALPLLALETASYDLRFGGEGVIRGRYLFYVAPILLIATAAALVGRFPVWGLVGASAFFAATVAFADFHRFPGIYLDSAESVLNGVIRDVSPGLPPGVFVALCGILIGAICLALVRLPRPAVMLGVTVLVFAFTASTTGYAFERLLSGHTAAGFPVTGQDRVRNWIDRAAGGRPVALLPYSISRDWFPSAVAWWDAEFWNSSIVPTYVGPNGRFTYAPFPSRVLRIGPDGVVAGTEHAPKFVLAALTDSRFGFAGKPGRRQRRDDAGEAQAAVARNLAEPGALPRRVDSPWPSGVDPRLRGTGQSDGEGQARGDAGFATRGAAQHLLPARHSHRLPCTHRPRRCGNDRLRSRGRPRGRPGAVGAQLPLSPARRSARNRDPSARSG